MTTIDLTDEQLRYLRTLVLENVYRLQIAVRSPAPLDNFTPATESMHKDIAIGSILIAVLPEPRK